MIKLKIKRSELQDLDKIKRLEKEDMDVLMKQDSEEAEKWNTKWQSALGESEVVIEIQFKLTRT